MIKLEFFVPESHLEATKQAVFAAGAGRIGNYDSCCWVTEGRGQFRPLAGADAFIGQQGKVEVLTEFKVELVLEAALKDAVEQALLSAHPYETPAYQFIALL
ncbi:NGG1p interacting factor 3 protein, NIF3 [Aliagarivorans taiwanensis]|uniref:NGG1p interacting factor 3 protein, NIF3 n=1 Tax=Aliagarivorans taiwanensis TaxID=561966 RepID=UPI0004100143|nr:NGG1p interacting factor 3 protein, NIF3 [Aliagarivorans taiwanensis]